MELLSKLERTVLGWLKGVPHLPSNVQKWLGDNIWWIVAIATVLSGLGVLGLLFALIGNLSALSTPIMSYYASTTFVTWAIVTTIVSLVFVALDCLLLALAINPLKEKQKKGWVLLFAVWLLGVVSVVVNAILTLNPFGFVTAVIFGAIWLAVSGYFLFEIHGQFAHVERSKGVKKQA